MMILILFKNFCGLGPDVAVRIDPARVATQIVAGIAFIGAGVIVKS